MRQTQFLKKRRHPTSLTIVALMRPQMVAAHPLKQGTFIPMDLVHDVRAALARNKSGVPTWADFHYVLEVLNIIFISNLHEMDRELCMEGKEHWEVFDIMQLDATRAKVKFNEHVDNGRWPLC